MNFSKVLDLPRALGRRPCVRETLAPASSVGRGGGVFFGISGFVFPTALAGGRRVGRPLRLACELDQLARDGFRRGRGRRKEDGPNGNEDSEERRSRSERLADARTERLLPSALGRSKTLLKFIVYIQINCI